MEHSELVQRLNSFRYEVSRSVFFEPGELTLLKRDLRNRYSVRLQEMKSNPNDVVNVMQSIKGQHLDEFGRRSSIPFICAIFLAREAMGDIEDIFGEFLLLNLEDIDGDILGKIVTKFDATMGISYVGSSIQLAEGEISKGADGIATEVGNLYRESASTKPDLLSEAATYLKVTTLASKYAHLLREDKTGFDLADYVVAGLRNSENTEQYVPRHIERDVVALGARAAADQYKVLYRLASKANLQSN